METALVVALVAGVVSTAAAILTTVSSMRNADVAAQTARNTEALKQLDASEQRRREVATFREPLARAAYDLQSRLYNILKKNFIEAYLTLGNERTKSYVVENTTFLICQFFCCTEIMRRELQLTDLDLSNSNQKLLTSLDDLHRLWASDQWPRLFQTFAGEQRAIGEALITAGERLDCMGYAGFLKSCAKGQNAFIDNVRADVESLSGAERTSHERLCRVQHGLVDMLDLLDPNHRRFPAHRRRKA